MSSLKSCQKHLITVQGSQNIKIRKTNCFSYKACKTDAMSLILLTERKKKIFLLTVGCDLVALQDNRNLLINLKIETNDDFTFPHKKFFVDIILSKVAQSLEQLPQGITLKCTMILLLPSFFHHTQ